jgi:hypothetical protein
MLFEARSRLKKNLPAEWKQPRIVPYTPHQVSYVSHVPSGSSISAKSDLSIEAACLIPALDATYIRV